MPAPNDAIDICNFALDHLKQKEITTINPPNTVPETVCARHYDHTRRMVLESHPWNFATKRKQLTPDTNNPPLFGYSFSYNLPADFLRLLTIGDDSQGGGLITPPDLYQVEDFKLLTGAEFTVDNNGTQNLRYTYDVTNVNQFSALFIDVLVIELALRMAYAFTGLASRVNQLNDLREKLSPRAYAVDGQQRPPTRVQRSKFRRSRRSNRGTVAGPNTVLP